jgi:beta-galactosidase beta subunit
MEKIHLTSENYGSIPRYYIETTDDYALTPAIQHNLIKLNPPNHVFKLKGSDHAPFFSKPQGLLKLLTEISQLK